MIIPCNPLYGLQAAIVNIFFFKCFLQNLNLRLSIKKNKIYHHRIKFAIDHTGTTRRERAHKIKYEVTKLKKKRESNDN